MTFIYSQFLTVIFYHDLGSMRMAVLIFLTFYFGINFLNRQKYGLIVGSIRHFYTLVRDEETTLFQFGVYELRTPRYLWTGAIVKSW